jgi:hypothetical protein
MELNMFDNSSQVKKQDTVRQSADVLNSRISLASNNALSPTKKSNNDLRISEVRASSKPTISTVQEEHVPAIPATPPPQVVREMIPKPVPISEAPKDTSGSSLALSAVHTEIPMITTARPSQPKTRRQDIDLSKLKLPPRLPSQIQNPDLLKEVKEYASNEVSFEFYGLQMNNLYSPGSIELRIHFYNKFHKLQSFVNDDCLFNGVPTTSKGVTFTFPYEALQEPLRNSVHLLDYLKNQDFFVDVIHTESRMYLGTVSIPAVHFLRQNRECIEYFIEGDIKYDGETKGRLYFSVKNSSITLTKKRERYGIQGSKKKESDEIIFPRKLADINEDLNIKLLQQRNKISTEDLDKLVKVMRFYQNPNNPYTLDTENIPKVEYTSKEYSMIYADRERNERVYLSEILKRELGIEYKFDIYPGECYIFEYVLLNPFLRDTTFTFEWDDTALRMIDNMDLVQAIERDRSAFKSTIKLGVKRTTGSYQVQLRAGEKCVVAFMYQLFMERKEGDVYSSFVRYLSVHISNYL